MKQRVLPRIYIHNLAKLHEGIGPTNKIEYCDCNECILIKSRRDKIFNNWYNKIYRWIDKNF